MYIYTVAEGQLYVRPVYIYIYIWSTAPKY